MNTNKRTARIAGLLYLVVVLSGMLHLIYVPSVLTVPGNPSATIENIIASETLFRLSIVCGLICYTAFLLLPLVLYKLLSPVNKTHAVVMVAFALVSVPISFINLLNKFAILSLIGKAGQLDASAASDIHAQAALFLDYYNNGVQLASIFWGLWLLPFGYLVFKSGILPRVFGILLIAGCFGYVIDFVGTFLFAGYRESGISNYISLPGGLGEIGICLWLLIMGAREKTDTSLSS